MDSRKRNPNWTSCEKEFAIEEIISRTDDLFGKFRGATLGCKSKERCWQEIADLLNSSGRTACIQTVAELKKLYYNCKGKAKEKMDSVKKTGGGAMAVFLPCEELIVNHLQRTNSAEATGISGGMESLCSTGDAITNVNDEEHGSTDLSLISVDNVGVDIVSTYVPVVCNQTDNPTTTQPLSSNRMWTQTTQHQPTIKRTTKRKRDTLELDLYSLEKSKIVAETKKFEAETAYWHNKKHLDDELYFFKKQLLQKQLIDVLPVHEEE